MRSSAFGKELPGHTEPGQTSIVAMKILYVGETWPGSCARSMKEALDRHPKIELRSLAEDSLMGNVSTIGMRVLKRLLQPLLRRRLYQQVLEEIKRAQPDVFMAYKGFTIHAGLLTQIKRRGVKTVNLYPDCSPHAHGAAHREAVGEYDLVISTKVYHPNLWESVYHYQNQCVFVPQGYDPNLHLVVNPSYAYKYDVVMIATYRQQYGELMLDFARAIGDQPLTVAIGGAGWEALRGLLPPSWHFFGPLHGTGYVSALRSGRVCVAPINVEMAVDGKRQPGDVETTRTYELAAAHCFFIHQRSDYVDTIYGKAGVPMFENGSELGSKVVKYLGAPVERERIAAAAHRVAVPSFSTDSRTEEIYGFLVEMLDR